MLLRKPLAHASRGARSLLTAVRRPKCSTRSCRSTRVKHAVQSCSTTSRSAQRAFCRIVSLVFVPFLLRRLRAISGTSGREGTPIHAGKAQRRRGWPHHFAPRSSRCALGRLNTATATRMAVLVWIGARAFSRLPELKQNRKSRNLGSWALQLQTDHLAAGGGGGGGLGGWGGGWRSARVDSLAVPLSSLPGASTNCHSQYGGHFTRMDEVPLYVPPDGCEHAVNLTDGPMGLPGPSHRRAHAWVICVPHVESYERVPAVFSLLCRGAQFSLSSGGSCYASVFNAHRQCHCATSLSLGGRWCDRDPAQERNPKSCSSRAYSLRYLVLASALGIPVSPQVQRIREAHRFSARADHTSTKDPNAVSLSDSRRALPILALLTLSSSSSCLPFDSAFRAGASASPLPR